MLKTASFMVAALFALTMSACTSSDLGAQQSLLAEGQACGEDAECDVGLECEDQVCTAADQEGDVDDGAADDVDDGAVDDVDDGAADDVDDGAVDDVDDGAANDSDDGAADDSDDGAADDSDDGAAGDNDDGEA